MSASFRSATTSTIRRFIRAIKEIAEERKRRRQQGYGGLDENDALAKWTQVCGLCASAGSYLDEIITDDAGGRLFVCSDTDHCEKRREKGYVGIAGAP